MENGKKSGGAQLLSKPSGGSIRGREKWEQGGKKKKKSGKIHENLPDKREMGGGRFPKVWVHLKESWWEDHHLLSDPRKSQSPKDQLSQSQGKTGRKGNVLRDGGGEGKGRKKTPVGAYNQELRTFQAVTDEGREA